jgi:uncharacterized repeat protein (TIGR03803 family)
MKPIYRCFPVFVFAFLISHFSNLNSQSRFFYGITAEGGLNNTGTIFKMDAGSSRLNTIYSFRPKTEGSSPYGGLTQAEDGKVYGVTTGGGKFSGGILFEWDPATNVYIKRIDFKDSMGVQPIGSLLLAQNGKLYGRTRYGGKNSKGTIFEWDPKTGEFFKVYDFEMEEYLVHNLMQASNGKIYGYTSGDRSGDGTIFEIDTITHVYSTKFSFKSGKSGSGPVGTLTEGDNHKLYGVLNYGGLFEWDPENSIIISKRDFPFNTGMPKSSLLKASNGKFYGIGESALYEWDPENDTITVKIPLDAIETGNDGGGALVEAGNGKIYGTHSNGGYYHYYLPSDGVIGYGTLFEWDIGTNEFFKKLDFNGFDKGSGPTGDLLLAKNGNLYGMTYYGGPNSEGLLFEWNPVTDTYSKKLNFNLSENGSSSLNKFIRTDNGKISGVSTYGGKYNNGALFELDTATFTYSNLFEFNGDSSGIYPSGNLIRASNGKWYGMTTYGGKYGDGVLYEWDFTSGSLIKKLDFNGLVTGRYPIGSLTEGKNGKLYGITQKGGIYGNNDDWAIYGQRGFGVLFEWDPVTEIFTKKYDFTGNDGMNPNSSLVRGSNGLLYGTASKGGKYGYGVFFEWNPEMNSYVDKIDFSTGKPYASLIQAGNGKFYGMKPAAGNFSKGCIYEVDPETFNCTTKFSFNGMEYGGNPDGFLIQGSNGKLYGTTKSGGKFSNGVFFEWEPESGNFKKLTDFNGNENGSSPIGGLLEMNHTLQDTIYAEACGNYISPSGKYTFSRTGIYKDFLKSVAGYDSVLTIYLSSKNSWSQVTQSVCDSFVSPSGRYVITSSGVYKDTIPNAAGCDSIITINLNLTKTRNILNISACHSYTSPSGKYTWYNEGTYTDTLLNFSGCDVVNTINLKFPGNTASTLYVSEYYGYTSPSGKYLNESGIYTDKIKNSFGCDSIITIYLTIGAHSNKYLNIAASCSYTSPSGKYVWDSSGFYMDTIPTKTGGDSILSIDLVVSKYLMRKIHARACGQYVSPSGKYIWDTEGFYTDTMSSGAGCDSLFSIDLIFDKVYTGVIQDHSTLKSIDVPAAHQWIDCDKGNIPIEGATNRIFTATHSGRYAVIVSNGTCIDTSAIHEVVINTATGLIQSTFESDVRLYPNPTEGDVSIDLGKVYADVEVTITGPDGKIVQKDRLKQARVTSLNMPEPAGIYVVTLTSGKDLAVFRIVKR